jgi:hypothetical protein
LQYLVKRKGLDLTDYGKVDIKQAKRQRLEEGEDMTVQLPAMQEHRNCPTSKQISPDVFFSVGSGCPVSIEMVDEYEQYKSRFWADVCEHTDKGSLDLGELQKGFVYTSTPQI